MSTLRLLPDVIVDRLPLVDNPRSQRVRSIVALGRRSTRLKQGLLRVEGPQAVRELLTWRADNIRDVYFQNPHGELWELAQEKTRWCHEVTPEVAKAVGEEAQGVFAVCTTDALQPVDWAATGAVVILPQTQDPGNAGTIVRAADAFGAVGVVACTGTVDLGSPKVIRASAGSVFHLGISHSDSFPLAVEESQQAGRRVLGAALTGTALPDIVANEPVSWVFGNEAQGLTAEEKQLCDELVSIPMSGPAESLNVALAAGICLYSTQGPTA